MIFVQRNAAGEIEQLSRHPLPGGEQLDESHPDVRHFLAGTTPQAELSAMDADFVRVIEDVIDTLIANQVIKLTDLPVAAQKKLNARKGARNRLAGALDLLGEDGSMFL